jgi:HEPN domain-containing protein
MADSTDFEAWVERAEQDVGNVRLLTAGGAIRYPPIVCFHCQQAAEKYLKACLIRARVAFPRTHDFEYLLHAFSAISTDVEQLAEPCARLQPYVITGRYPLATPSADEAAVALRDMECVRQFCRAFLGVPPEPAE